jgi:tellurite methyltransferase
MNQSVEFFSRQFERQIAAADYQLNPFEQQVLPHLRGRVLELGCGLGNFSLAAARGGHAVTAMDACEHAVADLQRRAADEVLTLQVEQCELSGWRATSTYDTVVSIGLLMFFSCAEADRVLTELQRATAAGGILALNVLIEGTTFLDMFEPGRYCLFDDSALLARFASWHLLEHQVQDFAAGADGVKRFSTVIAARRPNGDGA